MTYKPKTLKPKMQRTFNRINWANNDWLKEWGRNRDKSLDGGLVKLYKKWEELELMNKVMAIGRLVRDPELRYTPANKAVCTFTLAIDRQMSRDKKEQAEAKGWPTADFPRVNVWGNLAESCSKYLSKGSQCAVVGSIQTGSYQDKDGKTVYTTDILANSVEFLSKASESQTDTSQNNSNDDFFGNDFAEMEDNGSIPF